jgi:hypothetical protein
MKRYLIQIFTLLIIFIILLNFNGSGLNALENFKSAVPKIPSFLSADSVWVDSVINSMSLEEKIAQLIMIDGYSRLGVH